MAKQDKTPVTDAQIEKDRRAFLDEVQNDKSINPLEAKLSDVALENMALVIVGVNEGLLHIIKTKRKSTQREVVLLCFTELGGEDPDGKQLASSRILGELHSDDFPVGALYEVPEGAFAPDHDFDKKGG